MVDVDGVYDIDPMIFPVTGGIMSSTVFTDSREPISSSGVTISPTPDSISRNKMSLRTV